VTFVERLTVNLVRNGKGVIKKGKEMEKVFERGSSKVVEVSYDRWLDLTLKAHSPTRVNIGDQWDEELVTVCSCGNPGYNEAKKDLAPYKLYTTHLISILAANSLIIIP